MAVKTVAAALSGGVDSAVTALLLREQGYRVEGVTMCLCAGDDGSKALAAAEMIGIPCKVLDLRKEFSEKILHAGRREYLCGRTPNPCAGCNREFKFGILDRYAASIGACALATGHYARLEQRDGGVTVRSGADKEKNQVYFLALVRSSALARAMMPLGELTKSQVRELAAKYGLESLAGQKESQDVCVEADGMSFPETLAELFPEEKGRPGEIVDTGGRVIGRHCGLEFYTVGQRKGLGVAMGKPAYVVRLDVEKNQVVLSTSREDLLTRSIFTAPPNIIDAEGFASGRGEVQFRYRQRPMAASWSVMADGSVVTELDDPAGRPASGQVAAFFAGDTLLAGGVITGC